MTHYSLTPEERTQLSALLDNELPEAERESTLRLLAGSEDARRYLQHLRSLRSLTAEGERGVGRIVAASSPALTGAAIRTAANQYSGGLLGSAGSLLNGWMLAAAASVAILGGAFLATSTEDSQPTGASGVAAVSAPSSPAPVAQPVAVDTASMIVPPLTRTDLLAFAVDGTIPIEVPHRRYLTIAPAHGDSMKLTVHAKPPRSITNADITIPTVAASLAVLDSLADIVRTTVVRTRNGIALRQDALPIRAIAVNRLEQSKLLPSELRARVELVRQQLATADRAKVEESAIPVVAATASHSYIELNASNSSLLLTSREHEGMSEQTLSLVIDGSESHISIRTTSIQHDNRPSLATVSVASSGNENTPTRRPSLAHTVSHPRPIISANSRQLSDTVPQSLRSRTRNVESSDIDSGGRTPWYFQASGTNNSTISINLDDRFWNEVWNEPVWIGVNQQGIEEVRRALGKVRDKFILFRRDEQNLLFPTPPHPPLVLPKDVDGDDE